MSHDNFQPPEFDPPEMDDDDRMYGALSDLAGIETHEMALRDNPKAYEVLERLMTHAYAEGRKDQRDEADAIRDELVAALEMFIHAVDFGVEIYRPRIESARAALARAKGQA